MSRPVYTPILRELLQDPAVVQEFDHLAARLRGIIDSAILEARGIAPSSPTGGPGIEQDTPFYPVPTPDQSSTILNPTTSVPTVPVLPSHTDGGGNDDGAAAEPPVGIMKLLHAKQGSTTTSATAVNLDTVTISDLTALDCLYLTVTLEATGGTTTTPRLFNVTENLTMVQLQTANLTAGNWIHGSVLIRATPVDGTRVISVASVLNIGSGSTSNMNGATTDGVNDWSVPWTLALRADAIAAGATCHWKWAVYKIAGQES